ncbi:hypothetical protein M406DRAFT_66265 [Cryphonectria parasitica EP155]|uniref:Uncharacterized protein n=1 Tax=Cryphonectria parasitica (strain ATCC 38755 / EP155) TaxID=660469 RepID=A0A9P5CSZ7_CRYP1|nr:uncharacterized protein M406DRAFT_66265 [Cryphonectria parasitica EP155]KAF3769803.1 hypothetical protein M406DRAFT_66265 [Cryphonectria parasitica EP155]
MSQDRQPNLPDEVVFPDLQITADGLEGVDFNAIPDPDIPQWLKDVLEANTLLDAGQPFTQPSPPTDQPRSNASVITIRRSSGAGSNQSRLSITVQDKNGRKSSKEIIWDSAWDVLLQDFNAESAANQQAAALPLPAQGPVAPLDALPPATLPTPKDTPQLQGISTLSDLLEHQTLPPGLNGLALPSWSDNLKEFQPYLTPVAAAPSSPPLLNLLEHQPLRQLPQSHAPPVPVDPMLYQTPPAPGAQQYGTPAAPQALSSTNAYMGSGAQNLQRPRSRTTASPARQAPPTARANAPPKGAGPRSDNSGRPPLPSTIAPFVNPHHIPRNHGRVPDKRGMKDTTIANDFYYSISHLPALTLPYSGKVVNYSGVEFEPNLRFTANEFLEYLEYAAQRPDKTRRPILRIQIQPSQANHRYIRGGQSFKCRFQGCPDKRGTILKGQVRICIQEFEDESGDWLNPYHNAGYMHLYCLEQQVNLIELFRDPQVVVVPEDRKFGHEPPATTNPKANNPMALNDLEQGVIEAWVEEIGSRWHAFTATYPDPVTRPPFVLDDKDHLFHRLTAAHLENPSTKIIQRKRKLKAGGKLTNHLDQFVGDVSKQVETHKRMRAQREQGQNAPAAVPEPDPAPESPRKRIRTHGPTRAQPLQAQPSAAQPAYPLNLLDGYADDHAIYKDNYVPQQHNHALQRGDNMPVSIPRAGSHPGRRGAGASQTQEAETPRHRAAQAGVRKSPRRRSPRIRAGKISDNGSQTRRSSANDAGRGPSRRASAVSETSENSLDALLLDALRQDGAAD